MAISTCNLLLEHVPVATEATDSERNEVMAYAKVIRAMSYYILANYYADTYVSATAVLNWSVPLITSADIMLLTSRSLLKIYDFMIKDVKEAIQQKDCPNSQNCYPSQFGSSLCLGTSLFANGEL